MAGGQNRRVGATRTMQMTAQKAEGGEDPLRKDRRACLAVIS